MDANSGSVDLVEGFILVLSFPSLVHVLAEEPAYCRPDDDPKIQR